MIIIISIIYYKLLNIKIKFKKYDKSFITLKGV